MAEAARGRLVELERRGPVGLLVLDDPKVRNALSLAMVDELCAALDELEADESVSSVVVTGAPPAFCAGADLGHLGRADAGGLRAIYEGFARFARCPLPTVAAVNGAAVGAGMNLALACDVRVAGERARFETRFLALGLHPGGGHTYMLRRAVGPEAAATMLLLGEAVGGAEAARIGLCRACVPDGELVERAVELAAGAAAAPRELLVRTKASLARAALIESYEQALEAELEDQLWSIAQPAFSRRLAELSARIAGGRRSEGEAGADGAAVGAADGAAGAADGAAGAADGAAGAADGVEP